jgi:hypothetical protein
MNSYILKLKQNIMTEKQLRNAKCKCGSGEKFKKCCGKYSSQLYHKMTENEKSTIERKMQEDYDKLKSQPISQLLQAGLPNLKKMDYVKMILDCWSSEIFKTAVYKIDDKPIDENLMSDKKNQLLSMSDGVKLQCELRLVSLYTPSHLIFGYHIPKQYYANPLLIAAYEIYADPVSIELRCYGTPYEIERAIRLKRQL